MPGGHEANIPLLIIAAGFIIFGWTVGILAVRDYLKKAEIKDQQFEEQYFQTHCRDCEAELDTETEDCPHRQPRESREGVISPDLPQ